MAFSKLAALLATFASVRQVSAHGYVSSIIIGGVAYPNYNPSVDWYQPEAQRPIR